MQAANKLINNDKIFSWWARWARRMNNAVFGEQLQKGVPNLFPFTAARSMVEPQHPLKFALFSTYYDQVRAATKHFVEKEGKKTSPAPCTRTRISVTKSATACASRPRPARSRWRQKRATARQDTEFVAPITKLKSAGCDLVIMGSIIRDSIQSVGTARKLGWTDVTFVGQAASYDPIVAGAPGGIMEGFYSGTGMPYAYPDTSGEPIKAWSAKYKDRDQARTPTAPRSTAMWAATSSSRPWRRPART